MTRIKPTTAAQRLELRTKAKGGIGLSEFATGTSSQNTFIRTAIPRLRRENDDTKRAEHNQKIEGEVADQKEMRRRKELMEERGRQMEQQSRIFASAIPSRSIGQPRRSEPRDAYDIELELMARRGPKVYGGQPRYDNPQTRSENARRAKQRRIFELDVPGDSELLNILDDATGLTRNPRELVSQMQQLAGKLHGVLAMRDLYFKEREATVALIVQAEKLNGAFNPEEQKAQEAFITREARRAELAATIPSELRNIFSLSLNECRDSDLIIRMRRQQKMIEWAYLYEEDQSNMVELIIEAEERKGKFKAKEISIKPELKQEARREELRNQQDFDLRLKLVAACTAFPDGARKQDLWSLHWRLRYPFSVEDRETVINHIVAAESDLGDRF